MNFSREMPEVMHMLEGIRNIYIYIYFVFECVFVYIYTKISHMVWISVHNKILSLWMKIQYSANHPISFED